MNTKTFVYALVCLSAAFTGQPNCWAQEAQATTIKPYIFPSNYKQLVREAQEASAKILKEAGEWMKQGGQLAKERKYNEAIDAFNKADAILLKNNFTADRCIVMEAIAHTLVKAGRNQDAISAYRTLLYRQPAIRESQDIRNTTNAQTLFEFALLLHQAGFYQEAVAAYEKGVPLIGQGLALPLDEHFISGNYSPKRFLAAVYVGLALTARSDSFLPSPEEGAKSPSAVAAIAYCRQALKAYPNFALAHYYLAENLHEHNSWNGLKGPAYWDEERDEYKKAAQYGRSDLKAAAAKHIN